MDTHIFDMAPKVRQAIAEFAAKSGRAPAGLIGSPKDFPGTITEFLGLAVIISEYCPADAFYLVDQSVLDQWKALGVL
jgi:hypothetical protein